MSIIETTVNTIVFIYFASSKVCDPAPCLDELAAATGTNATISGDTPAVITGNGTVAAPTIGSTNQVMVFGVVPTGALVAFLVLGGVQVALSIIEYVKDNCCGGEEESAEEEAMRMIGACTGFSSAITSFLAGLNIIVFQFFTPWAAIRSNWYDFVIVVYLWFLGILNDEEQERMSGGMESITKPKSVLYVGGAAISVPGMYILSVVVLAMTFQQAAEMPWVVPPCRYPAEYWTGTALPAEQGNLTEGWMYEEFLSTTYDNCTIDDNDANGWLAYKPFVNQTVTVEVPNSVDGQIILGPEDRYAKYYGEPSSFYVLRGEFDQHHKEWAAQGYLFLNNTGVGRNSFEYVYSLIFFIQIGLMAPCLLCGACMAMKKKDQGGGGAGGITFGSPSTGLELTL